MSSPNSNDDVWAVLAALARILFRDGPNSPPGGGL